MNASELIERANDLPVVPEAGLRLLQLLGNPDTSIEDIVKVVECDPVLSAKLLKACNSAEFGMRGPVASIKQAVFYLGYGRAQRLATSLSFDSALSRSMASYELTSAEFWEHSMMTAHAAEVIADATSALDVDPSIAFTAGLLHDIGKLVVEQAVTDEETTEIRALIVAEGISRYEAERRVLGTDHGEVGGKLLEDWNLPWHLVKAIEAHHAPVFRPRPTLSAVVYLANCIAHALGDSTPEAEVEVVMDAECAAAMGFSERQWEIVVAAIQGRLKAARSASSG